MDYFKKMKAKFEQDGIFDESNDQNSVKSQDMDIAESNDSNSNDVENTIDKEIFYFRR